MKCKRCGNTVLPNQVFCNKCGAPIEDDGKGNKSSLFDDGEETKKGKISRFAIIMSILVALIVVLLIVLLIIRGVDKKQNENTNTETQSETQVVVFDEYSYRIPNNYSHGTYKNRLTIYDENDELLGAFHVQDTTFSKAIANKKQLIENNLKNTSNSTYTIVNQEQKNINGTNSYVYKVKITVTEDGETDTGYYSIAISELNKDQIIIATSYVTQDETTTDAYLEKLISIAKTAEKRTVNITEDTQNTVNTTQNSTNTINATNRIQQ